MNPPNFSSASKKRASAEGYFQDNTSDEVHFSAQDKLNALYESRIPVQEDSEFRDPLPIMSSVKPIDAERFSKVPMAVGTVLSAIWFSLCLFALMGRVGALNLGAMLPHEWGALMTGALAPVALIWFIVTQIQRNADTKLYGEILRTELQSIIFPSEDRQHRISTDIERLCQQASHLSSSSKAVLKSIHRARAGLQTEMRDFVGLSRKTEFHIDRLTDTLNAKSSRLISLTDELDERISRIESKASDGAQQWEKASKSVADRMASIETVFDNGTNRILNAAESAKVKAADIETYLTKTYSGLRGGVDDISLKLADLSTSFDQHNMTLARATDRVVAEASRLGTTIETQIDHLDEVSQTAMESMGQSSVLLGQQKQMLEEGAAILTSHAALIVDKIQDSLKHLNHSAELVETRSVAIEARLAKQAEAMGSVVANFASQSDHIEQAGMVVANRLNEALSTALSGSETVTSAVRRAADMLEKTSLSAQEQASRMVENTSLETEMLSQTADQTAKRIDEMVALLSDARDRLQQASGASSDQIVSFEKIIDRNHEKIKQTISLLETHVDDTQNGLNQPIRQLESVIRDLDDRHIQIEETLKKRVGDLSDASYKAKDQAENIRTMLRNQVIEISTLSGQISAHTKSIGEELFTQKSQLIDTSKDVLDRVEKVHIALEHQVESLQGTATSVASDINALSNSVSNRCTELRNATQMVLTDISEIDLQLDAKSGRLIEQSDALRQSLTSTLETIEKAVDRAEPVYLKAFDQAGQLHSKLEALNTEFDVSGTSNLKRLQEIGVTFDQRLSDLRSGSAEALQLLKTSSDYLSDRMQDIEDTSHKTFETLQFHEQSLENQRANIFLAADQTLLKMQAIQKTVENQFAELSESIGGAVAQIEEATGLFSLKAQDVRDASQSARDDLVDTSAVVSAEAGKLMAKVQETGLQAHDVAQGVKDDTAGMIQAASATLHNLKTLGDSFLIRSRELDEHMKSSLSTAQKYGAELKTQALRVGEASTDTADQIARAVMQLSGKVSEADRLSSDVLARIHKARAELDAQTEKFLSVSGKAVQASEEASNHYSRQSTSLFKASQDASLQAERIRDAHMRTQRDAFLTSAKFVLETLHSLSVDFTRQLDPDPSDRLWRAYQRGDVGAFTRRLIAVDETVNIDKVRDKFKADHEFRSYVQRYIRSFEELFDQALTNDQGDLLAATFLSSDIGRLYNMLCQASGKTPKSGRAESRAA